MTPSSRVSHRIERVSPPRRAHWSVEELQGTRWGARTGGNQVGIIISALHQQSERNGLRCQASSQPAPHRLRTRGTGLLSTAYRATGRASTRAAQRAHTALRVPHRLLVPQLLAARRELPPAPRALVGGVGRDLAVPDVAGCDAGRCHRISVLIPMGRAPSSYLSISALSQLRTACEKYVSLSSAPTPRRSFNTLP